MIRLLQNLALMATAVALAGCAKKKPAAVIVPPAPVPVSSPQVTPQATPKPRPAPIAATPVPSPAPVRPPLALQSSADPVLSRTAVEANLRQAEALISQLNARSPTGTAKDDRDRAAAMVESARQALKRGDLRQANDVAARAAMLAKTILNAK